MAVDNDENFLLLNLFFSFFTFSAAYSTFFIHGIAADSVPLADFIYSCRQYAAV